MPTPTPMLGPNRSRWVALGVISLGIGAGCWWLLNAGGLPVLPTREQLTTVSLLHVAVFSACYLCALGLRIWRWHWQLKAIGEVPMLRIFSVSLLGIAAVIMLPLRSGEFVKPALIARSTQVPFMAALATTGCERLVDALFAASLLMLSLMGAEVQSPLPDTIGDLPIPASVIPTLGYSAAGATLAASCLVLTFFYFRAPTIRLIKGVTSVLSPRLGSVLEQKLTELTLGLEFLRNAASAGKYLAVTFVYWAIHLAGVWYLLLNTGFASCTLSQAGVVLGTIVFSASLPNTPGFFGIFQIATYASLALFYEPALVQDRGSVTAFWFYVVEVGWVLVLTPFAWLLHHFAPRQAIALDR
jgi:glycosyltransferase 2 family protein